MSTPIRTRFAPSPTGFLHVGNVRAALFPWLVARHSGGSFILRVEDTDQAREVVGAVEIIKETLSWLGITWDEGPDIPGKFGPYIQSERKEIYRLWAEKLIETGGAYADPYTAEELETFRDQAKQEKRPFLFRHHRPENPPMWDGKMPLRFKSSPKAYKWHDEVMGDLSASEDAVDDFILIKSDGFPTYNFAHVVDDAEMGVTHVIRGLEYISSMPKYLDLYDALNLQWPVFAHMPHIMAPDGKKKLSKRDGAKSVLQYKDEGYLPEAMLNFLASLGWNDGTEQEVFSQEELIEKFSLGRVQRSGARFDQQRLLWLNGQWIRRLSLDELGERAEPFWSNAAMEASEGMRRRVLALVQDRLKTLAELPLLTDYFFTDPLPDWHMAEDTKQLKSLSHVEMAEMLAQTKAALELSEFDADSIQTTLNQLLEITGQKPGNLFSLIRLAVSWAPFSPALSDTLATLGKPAVLARLQKAIETSATS